MVTRAQLMEKREAIMTVARRFGAHDLRLFGSVARGENTERSDVDILAFFESGRTLLDHAGLIGELEDLLGAKVDVIVAEGMRPRFRAVVEKEALPL
jgi:predicted nucleotidyltransferase